MNKRFISLSIVLLITIGTLPALFANGETHLEIPDINPDLPDGCYQRRLIQSTNETLLPGDFATYSPPNGIREDCFYVIEISGKDNCNCIEPEEYYAQFYAIITLKNQKTIRMPDRGSFESYCGESISKEIGPIPGYIMEQVESVAIYNEGDDQTSDCSITYTWRIYSLCPCSSTTLYPKVDIEGFAVSGGATIVKDGKIVSAFNVVPGVQQTMIQVENRGFFTQKDARVRFIGLPEGVTVQLTPATQTIKAHNIGTYSATFTVGSNVPSGTYNIGMVAFSPNGIFDTIMIKLVVP